MGNELQIEDLQLGYGERQFGAHIKPSSKLIFAIELLQVLTRDD